MRRNVTRTGMLAVTAIALAATLTGPAVAAERRAPTITVTSGPIAFSPNGDGVEDTAKVTYRLARASRVTAIISSGDRFVLSRKLGRQGRGAHTFRWDGTRRGEIERDGRYSVTFLTGKGRARASIEVDNVWDGRPTAFLDFRTVAVFPRTTVIRDVATGGFGAFDGTESESVDAFTGSFTGLRLQAVASSGRVVSTDPLGPPRSGRNAATCGADCSVAVTWDGRDDRGRPLPPGPYQLRVVRGATAAGTPIVLTEPTTLDVSATKLVRQTVSFWVPAAEALRGDGTYSTPPPPSSCPPVASARFSGGLTFGQGTDPSGGQCAAEDSFYVNLDPSIRRTPYDTYTVSASGGPSIPGGADKGTLSVEDGAPVTLSGEVDETTPVATAWTTPGLDDQRRLRRVPATWTFAAAPGSSYDIEKFYVTTHQFGAPR